MCWCGWVGGLGAVGVITQAQKQKQKEQEACRPQRFGDIQRVCPLPCWPLEHTRPSARPGWSCGARPPGFLWPVGTLRRGSAP